MAPTTQRLQVACALLLALSAGCSDGPTSPEPAPSLVILRGSAPLVEETIAVGASLQLSTRLTDRSGKALPERPVTWSSTAPEVASVSATGLVTGVRVGTTRIVATVSGAADTVRVNVATPLAGSVACEPGAAPLRLSVGQVHATSAFDTPTLCVDGGEGSEYVLVPFFASQTASATRRFELLATGVVDATGSPSVAPEAGLNPAPSGAPTLGAEDDFHLRLRTDPLPALERRLKELHASAPEAPSFGRAASVAPVPRVGDRLRLNVRSTSGEPCSDPIYRTGRVVAVSSRAVIVADSLNPSGGFSDADYQAFASVFDQQIYPLNTRMFGEPSDIDENQRVLVFFTSAVNDLTRRGTGLVIGGFFFDRDLFPTSGKGACAGSNRAEMFYLMVPDPARAATEGVFAREEVRRRTLAVVGHELQHLINASRRLYVNRASVWEEVWLNEGLSHIAEELLFYQLTGLAARTNLDEQRLLAAGAQQVYREHQLQNELRLVEYLRNPEGASLMGSDDLAMRGAIWSFLRYAADRHGGDEREIWHRLVNSTTSGMANLTANLGAGTSPLEWMRDWAVSLYADDARLPVAPIYTQPSWNHRSLITGLGSVGSSVSYARYPLRVSSLRANLETTLQLQAGGAAYLRFGVAAGQRAAVRTSSGGLPAPSAVRLALIRTR